MSWLARNRFILTSLAACTVFAMLAAALTAGIAASAVGQVRAAQTLGRPSPAILRSLQNCESGSHVAPDHPRYALSFYDPVSGSPRTDQAPVLKTRLLSRLRTGETVTFAKNIAGRNWQARLIDADSRCGVVAIRPLRSPLRRPDSLWLLLQAAGLGGGAALVGAWLFIAWPLTRRIRALADRARTVGGADFKGGKDEDWNDLATIQSALIEADHQIKQDAAKLLEGAEALRSGMATTAHDLKTPLATLQVLIQTALQSTEKHPRALEDALRQSSYLASLIQNLETVAQFGADIVPERLERIDLRDVISVALARARIVGRADLRIVDHLSATPILVTADAVLLERLIGNLLQNAVTHGASNGGLVEIAAYRVGSGFQVELRDEGPGFSPDVLSALRQDKDLPEDRGRRRYGLFLAREIAGRLRWSIAFGNSVPGTGAIVKLCGSAVFD